MQSSLNQTIRREGVYLCSHQRYRIMTRSSYTSCLHFHLSPIQTNAGTEAAPLEPTTLPQEEEPEAQSEAERAAEPPPDAEVKRLKHVTDQER